MCFVPPILTVKEWLSNNLNNQADDYFVMGIKLRKLLNRQSLGQFVYAVSAWGSDRAVRAHVIDKSQKIVATVESGSGDRGEGGEVISTVGQEIVHGDVVEPSWVKVNTIQLYIAHRD